MKSTCALSSMPWSMSRLLPPHELATVPEARTRLARRDVRIMVKMKSTRRLAVLWSR